MFKSDLFFKRDPSFKKNVFLFFLSYFLVMFNYPLVRASSTSFFFEIFGAKSSPLAWLWSVGFLAISVIICNRIQSKSSVQNVFLWASVISTLLFFISALGYYYQIKQLAYLAFIWKEIYIVIQVHLLLAYANNYFTTDDFRILIGPVGALGSIGGIIGGLATSYISSGWGTLPVMWISVIFILLPSIVFMLTPKLGSSVQDRSKKKSPLSSLNAPGIRKYVLFVALIIMLTQFTINIMDFRFNLAFEAAVLGTSERTIYLGQIYAWTNFITFILQIIFLPYILSKVKIRSLHLFIPVSYLALITFTMSLGSMVALSGIAMSFIFLKASDYSLFSSAKEILYQPLDSEQKYGAKYLTDMIVYRAAKALIATVLIYVQSLIFLNVMMVTFIIIWIGLVFGLFRLHKKLFI